MHTRNRFHSVIAMAMALVMVFAGTALADNVRSDLDAVLNNDQTSTNLGTVPAGSTQSVPVLVYLQETNGKADLPISVSGGGNHNASMAAVTISAFGKENGPSGNITFTAPPAQATAQSYSITFNFASDPSADVNTGPAEVTISFSVAASAPTVVAPQVSYTLTPAAPNGDNGWYNTGPGTLTWTITGTSPSLTGCDNQNITADQAKTTYSCEVTNSAGSDSKSVEIGLDSTPPSIVDSGATAGPNGSNGWYTTAVTNKFTASNVTSGLAFNANPITKSSGTAEVLPSRSTPAPSLTWLATRLLPSTVPRSRSTCPTRTTSRSWAAPLRD